MSEIKVGEYIRSKKGYIAKVTMVGYLLFYLDKTIDFKQDSGNFYSGINCIDNEDLEKIIAKHSPNIIDLIEVGDYVNGCLIVEISKDPFIKGQTNLWTNMLFSEGEPFPNEYYKVKILEKDIKSIVTKEQFAESEYRINKNV